jgi:hypothetical protein
MKQLPKEQDPNLDEWKSKPVKKKIDKSIPGGYLLKVQLCDITPAIWRTFTVPADITLGELHTLLQLIMGWTNSHLHGFRDEENCYGPFDEEMEDQIDERSVLLTDMFRKKGSVILYDYDFGDGWEHQIHCEEILPKVPEIEVIDGRRACPPDDCGGVPGYYRILKILTDSDSDEHGELTESPEEEYDPNFFDAEQINRSLQKINLIDL